MNAKKTVTAIPDAPSMSWATNRLISASLEQVFGYVTKMSPEDVAKALLDVTLFIDPDSVRKQPVQFPEFVRASNQHHPGKRKGDTSLWNGRTVTVTDNTKARLAFGRYAKLKMGGAKRTLPVGWEVAHIWGRVFDPLCFTAGWNMVLLPGFLRVLIEEQAQLPQFSQTIQAIAFKQYFGSNPVQTEQPPPRPLQVPDWLGEFRPRMLPGIGPQK